MNTTLSIAFLAGVISFLSPCVLPLIPGYISYISGSSLNKLIEKEKNLVVIKTIFFTFGFSLVFIILGSTASYVGKFFLHNSDILKIVAGIIIIFFSLQLIGIVNFKFMDKDVRFFTNKYSNNLAFPLLVGAAFGFGWTPCIGPILGSILALAAIEENFGKSILMLSFYSLGLAIPFILSGYYMNNFLTSKKSFGKYYNRITKTGGTILLITGVLIATNQIQVISYYILTSFPFLTSLG